MANPVVVIGSHFSVPHQVGLELRKKESCFYILRTDGSILFQIKDEESNFHERRVLLDSAGNCIINLKQKIMTTHQRWQVFRGNSRDKQDLLFSVTKPNDQQSIKPKLHVFLASNPIEGVPDFRIEGSWSAGSFAIYIGKYDSIIIAQLLPNTSVVTVDPNIDYAFILTLIVILYEIFEGVDGSAPAQLDAIGSGFVRGFSTGVVQAIGAEFVKGIFGI